LKPDLGAAYLDEGDIWDAVKELDATLVGAVLIFLAVS